VLNRTLPIIAAVAACSSPPKPAPRPPDPVPVSVPAPVVTPDAAPPEIAESELCPRLVDQIRDESGGLDPAKLEALIGVVVKHCAGWPAQVRRCLVTSEQVDRKQCFDGLDATSRDGFQADITATFRTAPDCATITAPDRVSGWMLLPDKIARDRDRELAYASVSTTLRASCDAGWSDHVRTCVGTAIGSPRSCLDGDQGGVSVADRAALDRSLDQHRKLFTRAAAFKPKDKKIRCDKVVAAHYGDKHWAGKLGGTRKAVRKKRIKASAKALAKACTAERWSPFVRGCVVAAGSLEQRSWCIDTVSRWTYPVTPVRPATPAASTQVTSGTTGIPACDAYLAGVERYLACDKIPAEAKDATREGAEAMKSAWRTTSMPDDARKAVAEACTTALDGLRTAASTIGCPL
jgi:hypothetical protein